MSKEPNNNDDNANESINGKGLFGASGISKSMSIYLPATVVYRGISFFRGIVLAWLLAKETGQFGLLSIALQAINILAPLVSLGFNEAITRYVPAYQEKKHLKKFLKLAGTLTLGLSLIITLILLLLSTPLGSALFAGETISAAQTTPLSVATLFAILAIIAYFLVIAILKGLRMFTALSLMELVHGILFLALALAAVSIYGQRAEVVIWTYSIAMLIPTIIWSIALVRKLPLDATDAEEDFHVRTLISKLATFGLWASMAGIIWQSWQIYSLWHLAKFDSAEASDLFAAARLLGQLVLIVASAISAVILTNICVIWEKGHQERAIFLHDFYTKIILLGLLFAGLVMIALRGPLAMIFPEKFENIRTILPAMILFYQFSAVLSFMAIRFVLMEKMRLTLWPWLSGLVANIFLAFILISSSSPLFGAVHAAIWSTLPAFLVTILLLRAEGQSVSMGLILTTLSSAILLLPIQIASLAFALLIVWSLLGKTIFNQEQKEMIRSKLPFHQ